MKPQTAVTAWLTAGLLLMGVACAESPAASAKKPPSPIVHSFAGGCAGTVLTDAQPPTWAQDGWTVAKGTEWPVPWAMGQGGNAIAYVFARQLVAGESPRIDGTQNKVLWVLRDKALSNFVVSGHPEGRSAPVVTIVGGPSITDVPTAGCWTFQITWTSGGQHTSTINLDVLPKGALPVTVGGS